MDMEGARKIDQAAEDAGNRFERIADAFTDDNTVTRGGNRGFCSGALKVRGKVFAFISAGGEYIVKLPRDRAAALIRSGLASHFDPGRGRPMKEWVAISPCSREWLEFAREARQFVADPALHGANNLNNISSE